MDPLSITAGIVGITDTISKLSSVISQFRQDYKLADEDLNIARSHALLLREEIKGLESRKATIYSQPGKKVKGHDDSYDPRKAGSLAIEESSFVKAMSTACELLADIEAAFPLRSEPHTWRTKVRWAIKDKEALAKLKERLQSAESTLQGILAMEQLRVSRMIYGILLNQQSTMDRLESGEIIANNIINMAVVNPHGPQSSPAVVRAQFSELKQEEKRCTQVITKPSKSLPRSASFDRWGVSTRLVVVPNDKGASYRAAVHVSVLGKLYSIQLRLIYPGLSPSLMLHVRNIIPVDSQMSVACRTGDFDRARQLLTSGLAHGSDITPSGWPMIDYAIESGSARVVRLLLEYGAELDMAYGEHNMTALQSSFLRGRIDIARMLLGRGADIEHVDSDGYSVLSYLWVVEKRLEKSEDFMRLCQANEFSEVNACDSRGWTAFHRAAAVGTSMDVEAFLQLGASLDLRAEWYGWTALFFAASHDNVETFLTIVEYSRPGVYESLDGDGWNLLHCCIYFGAPNVMRLVLQNGVDINQLTHPAPLPEDPELSYKELKASDIARYIGPNRYRMFIDILAETGRDVDMEGYREEFWDATDDPKAAPDATVRNDDQGIDTKVYGAEDVDDRFTLLHWASYNGSPKIKRLFLLKGTDPEHAEAITLEENQTHLPTSPFDGR